MIQDLNLSAQIEIVNGFDSEQYREHLQRCHWVLSPSVIDPIDGEDGQLNTLKEAALAGVPIISTAVGGIPEMIKHKEIGLIVEANSGESLADGVLWLINNEESRNQMVEKARDLMKKEYSIDSLNKRFNESLMELVRRD